VLSNAAQAMEQGGTISVQAVRVGRVVRVSFIDSGPGFDPEHIEKSLDPFYTTKSSGTGLGLAIVKNIVSAHDGTMSLQNQEGAGARVDMEFPKA
jgi:signal transduction histidine kinase